MVHGCMVNAAMGGGGGGGGNLAKTAEHFVSFPTDSDMACNFFFFFFFFNKTIVPGCMVYIAMDFFF